MVRGPEIDSPKPDRQLVVFVHGWGASREDWWGTTRRALEDAKELSDCNFYFHQYTSSRVKPPKLFSRFLEIFLGKAADQELGQLGEHLWSNIKNRVNDGGYNRVLLFGHSFGGLVVADAIGYANRRVAEGDESDKRLLKLTDRFGLCCSPLAGANLAQSYNSILGSMAPNPHIQGLLADNAARVSTVDAFVDHLQSHEWQLTVFRASEDGVVDEAEIYEPLDNGDVRYYREVLEGTHSACVQDIGPVRRKDNFEKVKRWILQGRKPEVAHEKVTPVRRSDRGNYAWLVRRLENELSEEPFQSWGSMRDRSPFDPIYLLRIFLQQLVYAASRIDSHAVGSANLWVAQFDTDDRLHLRSEEREGFFATNQLLQNVPIGSDAGWGIRPNWVRREADRFERNSAGARAFLRNAPELVEVGETAFPSASDLDAGVTHILGIPLFVERDLTGISESDVAGAPLAITVDLRYDADPPDALADELKVSAQEITRIFRIFAERWGQSEIRLPLRDMRMGGNTDSQEPD